MLQSDRLKIWDLCSSTANSINFHYRANSEKKQWPNFSIIPKKHFFGPFCPYLKSKNFFQKNPALFRTTSHRSLILSQNLEKTKDPIPRKHPDRWMDGWADPIKMKLTVQNTIH